ncbi:MAG TPA: GGDEF domain-containing protein [Anaerolineales bacterium]
MTADHEELLASFTTLLERRNFAGLRLAALLLIFLFPLFWIVDWVALPRWAMVTLWLRLLGILYSLSVWLATFRLKHLIYRHTNAVAISLGLLIGWLIAIMAWLDDGYESPYYAGLNLVILGASFLFAWPLRLSMGFNALLYGVYMAPLLFGSIAVDDPGFAITNQSFLVSTILITIVAQQYRLAQERRDYISTQHQQILLRHAEVLAATDPLTGLYNRRQFFSLGAYELPRARRLNQHLSILAIDVDYFKKINDTHGHLMGDELLCSAAKIFQSNLREQDILARIGGDEFVVLLPDTNLYEAASVAERIRLSTEGLLIQSEQYSARVTISIGVATLAPDMPDLDALLSRCDEALYAAKRAGRARVCVWSVEAQENSTLPVS